MVDREASRIATPRLVLEPVTRRFAEAVVTGRLGGICAGPGWPHQDTADAMVMALSSDSVRSWVITVDGVVIGDRGAFGWPDERGVVEIGYGIAEPFRRRGFATEAVAAMCEWLATNAAATAITATSVEVDNLASRRVLEKLGFTQVHSDDRHVGYLLGLPGT